MFSARHRGHRRGAGTEVQWTVPESLAAEIPDSPSGTGTLTCKTYNGGTLIGTKTVTFTASVPAGMKPALTEGWAAVTYDNSGTKAGAIAAWVQGYSKAKAVFDSTKIACKQGASIAKYAMTYLGKTVEESPYRTDTISATSATVRCAVTDSRGLTAWEDVTVTLESYAPPMLVGRPSTARTARTLRRTAAPTSPAWPRQNFRPSAGGTQPPSWATGKAWAAATVRG